MSVKVLGGFVSVDRTWHGVRKRWIFFPNWQDLVFESAAEGGLPTAIYRGDLVFALAENNTAPLWTHKGSADRITFTNDVYRWENIQGDWIEFASDGRMTTFGDRNITMATAVRDSQDRVAGLRDHNDLPVLTFEYTGSNLTRASDYSGREVLYTYDGADLVTVTDVRGNPWGYTYSDGNLSTKTDAEGRVTTITYAADGTLKSIRDQDGFGSEHRYAYDSSKRQYYTYVQQSGNVVTETWIDSDGELLRRDLNGRNILNMRRVGPDRIYRDENGNESRIRYDAVGRVTGVDFADDTSVRREFAMYDLPSVAVNEDGMTTTFEYDTRGNLTRITEAEGLPEQRITEFTYDANGQLVARRQVVDGTSADGVTTFSYDDFGNATATVDAEGNVVQEEYDALGNRVQRVDGRGKVWLFEYDAAGNFVGTEDPLGNKTIRQYDKVGNLVKYLDEEGASTQLEYNRQNKLSQLSDALGHKWTTQYTKAGLIAREIDPEGHGRAYNYDRDGRLISTTDANGNSILVSYLQGNSDQNPKPGRLERVVYPTFSREYQYDARNRIVATTEVDSGGTRITSAVRYDRSGRMVQVVAPDGRGVTLYYDSLDRLSSRELPDGSTMHIERDVWGRVIHVTDPKGHLSELHFDKLGRRISTKRPGGAITHFTYDAASNPILIVDPRGKAIEYVSVRRTACRSEPGTTGMIHGQEVDHGVQT